MSEPKKPKKKPPKLPDPDPELVSTTSWNKPIENEDTGELGWKDSEAGIKRRKESEEPEDKEASK